MSPAELKNLENNYVKNKDKILKAIKFKINRIDEAEDILHEIFLRFLEEDKFIPAKNRIYWGCYDYLNKNKANLEPFSWATNQETPEDSLFFKEIISIVCEYVESLLVPKPRGRTNGSSYKIFIERFINETDYDKIGEKLNVDPRTAREVSYRLHKAILNKIYTNS